MKIKMNGITSRAINTCFMAFEFVECSDRVADEYGVPGVTR
jgi:hypothetical protein